MPEKIKDASDIAINIKYVVGGFISMLAILTTTVSSYAIFVVKAISKKIEDVKETAKTKAADIDSTLVRHEDIHGKIFDDIKENSNDIREVKTEIKNLKGG